MFVLSISEHSLPSEAVTSGVSGFAVFSIWLAVGLVAVIVGAIAVRVSTQRLKRLDVLLAEQETSDAATASYGQVSAAA